MLGMLGGLIDVEGLVKDKIQDALENVAAEINVSHKELFFTIEPLDQEFNFRVMICKRDNGSAKYVRELTVRDIVGSAD